MRHVCALCFAWLFVVEFAAPAARAGSDVWDGNGVIPPNGAWGAGANWVDNTTPGNSDTATFNFPAAYSVVFNANPGPIQALTVTGSFPTLTSSGGARSLQITSASGSRDVTVNGASVLTLGTDNNPLHLTVSDDLIVNGGGVLSAKFGSRVSTLDLLLATTGGSGTVAVDGADSEFNVTNNVSMGLNGNTAILAYANDAQGTFIGTVTLAESDNAVSAATLNVASGADVLTGDLNVGTGTAAATGTVSVSGASSTLTQTGGSAITVGTAAAGIGNVNIGVTANAGTLNTGTGTVTINAAGTVTIGSGANLGALNANGNVTINGGSLVLGQNGDFNLAVGRSFTVQNGGEANFAVDYRTTNGATYLVTGAGSKWTNSDDLVVGNSGTTTFSIQDGGSVSNTAGVVALNPGSTGSLTITGVESTWTNSSELTIGDRGTGTLAIEAGGEVSSTNGVIGRNLIGSGAVTVTSAGSTWTNSESLTIGFAGTGALSIAAEGSVTSGTGAIGNTTGSTGTVIVTGAKSSWKNTSDLIVGNIGAGSLRIEAGGSVSNQTSTVGKTNAGETGSVTVTGLGSTWSNSSSVVVGDSGVGTLSIQAGGAVSSTDGAVGRLAGSTGAVTVHGVDSTWTNSSSLSVGSEGTGTLLIDAGGRVSNSDGFIGATSSGLGAVTVTGSGTTWNSSGSVLVGGVASSSGGAATLNVENGGTVHVGSQLKIWNDGTVNLSGGTIRVPNLAVSGGEFNFHSGSLQFTGAGGLAIGSSGPLGKSLNLTANQTLSVADTTTIDADSLLALNGGTLAVGMLTGSGTVILHAGRLNLGRRTKDAARADLEIG